jgi:hypothetical protein
MTDFLAVEFVSGSHLYRFEAAQDVEPGDHQTAQ